VSAGPADDRSRAVSYDASGLEILADAECFRLLRGSPVGRVVFTAAALPAVLPVNYALDDDGSVVFRTGARTRLAAAAGTVVAFEADEVQADAPAWSVVVTGRLAVVRDDEERERLARIPLRSWVPAARDLFLRITPELVTGRRLPAHRESGTRTA
jgi:hypothetical protein